MMNIQDSRLLRDKEAADLLGIAPQTLRKSRMDGMLLSVPAPKAIYIGRSVRYKLATLMEWVEQQGH